MWIFWPDFWVEFWKVNFGRWISRRWIFEGASFPAKNRTKELDPRIRVRNSGVQNSFPRIRAQIRVPEAQNPLCRNLSLTETWLRFLYLHASENRTRNRTKIVRVHSAYVPWDLVSAPFCAFWAYLTTSKKSTVIFEIIIFLIQKHLKFVPDSLQHWICSLGVSDTPPSVREKKARLWEARKEAFFRRFQPSGSHPQAIFNLGVPLRWGTLQCKSTFWAQNFQF